MDAYRIYFLDGSGRICAAQWFQAQDDQSAMWIAEHLSDACADVYPRFELWHMARHLSGGSGLRPTTLTPEAVNQKRQDALASAEETLRDSASRIAESRRLLERIEANRAAKRANFRPEN
jgi:hypothetical protein